MALLRKSTLVFAEILLLIAVTAILMLPEYVMNVIGYLSGLNYWLRLVIVILVNLLIIFAVFSQLRGSERYRGRELVVEAGDCDTTITTESTRQRLQRAIYGLQDIETVEGTVKGKRGKAVIDLEITTSKDEINIPEKQREIDRVLKQVVVKQMGIKLAQPPVVNIRLASDAKASETLPESTPTSPSPTPASAAAE